MFATGKSAIAQIGTLTKNTDPHQKCSSRKPPAIGPRRRRRRRQRTRCRSLGALRASVNTFVRIASVAGKIRAAPMPIDGCAAIS